MKHVSAYRGAGLNPNRVTKKKPAERVSAYATEEKNRGGLLEGTGYVAGRLGLGLAGVGEGVLDIAAAGGDLLRGDTEMAKYRFLDNRTADAQQSLTEWYNPGKGMQFAGDVASGVGQSSVFLLDALVPGLGTGLFFGGITGQSVAGAAQQTGDVGLKEIGYGVASGAAEAALGKLVGAGGKVAGKLGSSLTRSTGKAVGQRGIANALTKATGKRMAGMGWNVVQNTLADAASEFTEEFSAEYIDTSLQILFGIDPNASTSFGEAFRAGAVGFVSGAAMGAPANVYNYKNSVAAGKAIREDGGVNQLLYRAAATVDVLKEQEAQAREKGRTKATATEDAGVVGKAAAKGKQAVANLGAKITASKTKGYWTKLEKNINAYTSMDETMRNSEAGDALLGELRGNLFFTNMSYAVEEAEEALKTATDEQITEWLVEVNDKAKKAGKADANYTVEDFRANKDGILSTVAAAFWIDEIRRAAKGTGSAEKATEKPTEATTSPWDGMADHEDMSGYKAAGEAEEALLKAAVKESVPRGSVQAMLDEFRKGTDMTPEEFAAAWSDGVHIYGRYGFDVGEESPLSRMRPEAREAAMKFGRETEEAERKASEEKAKAKKKPAEMEGKKGTVVRGEGLEIKTLSDEQYAAYKAAEVLAEVLGTEIVIETDITDKKGRTVNGYYDTKTNRLHVNINALRDGKNISLYTLGHEVTHYIKEWSPAKFEALADFVLDQMGVNAETAVAEKLASLKRLGIVTDTMTVAEANALAREELVAEGMELVLTDGKVLEELAKTDKTLWEKIRDWIFDIIGKIRRSWESLNQASKTAQVLKETVESLEEIERLFTEGVREAGERTRTAGVETVTRMNKENMHDRVYSSSDARSQEMLDFYDSVLKMKDRVSMSKRQKKLGTVSASHAKLVSETIKRETGKDIDLSGYELWIDGSAVEHIEKRHGKNGKADHSMKDREDIARIPWVANAADQAIVMKKDNGEFDMDSQYKNSDKSPSYKVKVSYKIGESTYYVAECVPDSESKKMHIISAYIEKGSKGQELDMDSDESPQLTSETLLDSNATKGSITQPDGSVNTSTENSAENSFDTEDGVMIDPASGTAMLSVDDIPKTEQEIDDAVNRLVAKLGVDESRARKWVEDEISLATLILRDDMVDYAHRKADRRLTAIVKNSDYKQGTLDFSNICRKRREYTRMMQRIQQAFPNRRFTAEEFATIRKIMVDEGLEVACGLCYVEDRRQNEGYIAETFQRAVEAWRKGNRDTYYDTKNNVESAYNKGQAKAMAMLEGGDYVPTIADLTTVEGMNNLQAEHKDILQAWKAFNNARGMSSARLLTNEAEYQRQILRYRKDQVKRINDLGGLRVFSFSDFEEFHLIDIIQAVQDCAAMGIKIQFYTKVPSFALLMKDTKAKGNLSLIPKGDLGYEMKNGERVLVYDPVEGIDFNDPAFKKVARGNPNIGTILVGINDTQIRAAMADDFIDYIIPFHTGQTEVVRQIKKIGKWKNYKNEQVDKPLESGSKAKPVNVYTDVIAAAEREGNPIRNERQFVERFLKVCEERGLRPRFSDFLNTNADGKYVYTKGYYKLLLDFKMFDKDGTYLPQEPVIPEFDADLLHELTEKYVAGEKAKTEAESPAFKRALERVEAEVVGDDEGRMYSIDESPETPDVSAFDEALRRSGLSGIVESADEVVPEAELMDESEADRRQRIKAHEMLAKSLMEAAQTEQEFVLVKKYQQKAAELADAEMRIEELRKKTASVNRDIEMLESKKETIDRDRPEPEVKEAEAWIENELGEAKARKQSYMEEMDRLGKLLRDETGKLLSIAAAKPLRKTIREAQRKATAMELSAKRSKEREKATKEWAKATVKQARTEANEQKRESREWAKATVKKIRTESNEKIKEAKQDAQDYKAAIHKTSMEKVYKARRDAIDYKRAVYRTAYAKADEKNQKYRDKLDEMAKRSMERREITIRMREARRVLGYLNTMLYHPTKQKHVPESLQALVDKTLRSADPKQFGINRDHIREMSELAGKIRKLESKAGRTTDEQETLDKMKTKYEKLEADTISVKRQAEALMTAFEQYVTSTTDGVMVDKDMLDGLRQTVTEIEEAPLNEMTLKSLQAVEKIYTVIYHQVNTANQAFATEKAANIDEMSTKANTQVKNAKELKFLSPRAGEWAGLAGARSYLWKNMKPLTVFEAIGSDELMSIFKRVLDGEDVWITDILEAKKALDEAKKEYGYNKWNLKERREVTTADGSKVSLTLGEMMSLYAYMFRDQAEEHLSVGGFVFAPNAEAIESFKGDKGKYRTHLNDQTPHRMRLEDIAKMSALLTEEQRAYARAVQEYLTSLGAKGNEVSRKLYGIDLFKETAYFPIKSSHDYIETSTGKSGDPNIKSRGTFKETVPRAGNPIVLEDFMEVVGNHVNTMATYHAFVLPVEDLTRVWNYTPVNIKRDENGKAILDKNGMPVADTEGKAGYNSLKAEITKKYGKEANDYILQLLRDLNGGARRESAASILDKGLTAFKRSATMLSLSTIVQQPTSIIRAMAYVDAKHFTGASFVPWETVKKYAPVAAIKEVGGHDTNTGARTVDYINAKQYDSIKDAAKAAVTPEIYGGDPNVRAEAFGWLTGKADEVSWRYLFGAIVNEQAEKLGKPKDSEEVLKAAGERFAEVVRRTQVYDSTLTRSEYMRSKDGLMKMATAFGAEPTTVVSMAVDAIIKAERGDKTFLRKSAAGIAFSVIANAAVASLIYAMRDDDEDETIPEKYVQSLTSELIEGFNPLEYLPIARDVMSMFKGYEIERSDMALIGNLMEQVELITSSKRSVPDKIFGVTGAVTAFFGLPVTNVYRDVKGLVKTGASFATMEKQTGAGFGYAMGDAVSGQFNLFAKLFGKDSGNAYELYTAYVKGDTAHYERVKARYETDKDAEMALRTELRDNDKRINQAAWAKHTGDLDVYESLVDQIESEGIFDRDIVIRAVNNEVSEIKREIEEDNIVPRDETDTEEEENSKSLYKTSDLNDALTRGDREDFEDIYYYLLATKQEQGKTEAQAKAAVKSGITSYWKKQYLAAWEENNTAEMKRILELLEETELYGEYDDVATMAQKWIQES